jgi:hypothetical protein
MKKAASKNSGITCLTVALLRHKQRWMSREQHTVGGAEWMDCVGHLLRLPAVCCVYVLCWLEVVATTELRQLCRRVSSGPPVLGVHLKN